MNFRCGCSPAFLGFTLISIDNGNTGKWLLLLWCLLWHCEFEWVERGSEWKMSLSLMWVTASIEYPLLLLASLRLSVFCLYCCNIQHSGTIVGIGRNKWKGKRGKWERKWRRIDWQTSGASEWDKDRSGKSSAHIQHRNLQRPTLPAPVCYHFCSHRIDQSQFRSGIWLLMRKANANWSKDGDENARCSGAARARGEDR